MSPNLVMNVTDVSQDNTVEELLLSVSYTHLDVYKRQPVGYNNNNGSHVYHQSSLGVRQVRPVSYTHLDVYKRQE